MEFFKNKLYIHIEYVICNKIKTRKVYENETKFIILTRQRISRSNIYSILKYDIFNALNGK